MVNQNGMFEDKLAQTHNEFGINMDSIIEVTEVIMKFKLEVKLGELMRICPQLKRMVKKSLIKMRKDQVVDVCKVTTKVEDFDEVMLVVQVQVGKFEIICVTR